MKTIAIVGRPNVGKSTLFNRVIGKKLAITYDVAGTTRDWKDAVTEILGVKFRVVDTAGLEKAETGSLQAEMMKQTESALGAADMIILTVDGVAGITEDDKFFAKHLRKSGKKIILAVNKCEKKIAEIGSFYKLGLGEPVAVSAEHNLGMIDLYERILSDANVAPIQANSRGKSSKETRAEEADKAELQIAIIGRPNAGKSTIINKILGSERVITSEVAGTTRDAIEIDFEYSGRRLKLIDTAGMRRKSHIKDELETFSVKDSLEAVKYAQVVVLVVDAAETLATQDLRLAGHVVDEGRALIIAINKWDLVKDKKAYSDEIEYLIGKQLGDIHGVKVLKFSALHDKSLNVMLDEVFKVYETWNTRVPTGKLNQWIEFVLSHHPPPIAKGRRIKIRYITQTKTRPPSFMLSCSQPDGLPDSYVKYLVNDLRKNFALEGVPIRVTMPKKSNPYEKNKPPQKHMPN